MEHATRMISPLIMYCRFWLMDRKFNATKMIRRRNTPSTTPLILPVPPTKDTPCLLYTSPGFRKGKASQAVIEKMYGEAVFYEDAADEAINSTYAEAMKESGLDIVSRPEITVEQIGKDQAFIYSALAVSYTHLDAYKRQVCCRGCKQGSDRIWKS